MATTTSLYGGRIQCILLSTLDGYVIYERFYDQFNDIQKAEIRTSFDEAVGSHDVVHGLEVVGRFKNGKVVGLVSEEVILFALGTGNYDELILLDFLESLVGVLKDVLPGTQQGLSDAVLFQQYVDLVHAINEMCKDGMIELVDPKAIERAMNLKMVSYKSGQQQSQTNDTFKGLVKKFTSKEIKLSR
eukprot:jgi/Picre1/27534/NNA_000501.t1